MSKNKTMQLGMIGPGRVGADMVCRVSHSGEGRCPIKAAYAISSFNGLPAGPETKRGNLNVPVIGVGLLTADPAAPTIRANENREEHGGVDPAAWEELSRLLGSSTSRKSVCLFFELAKFRTILYESPSSRCLLKISTFRVPKAVGALAA